MERGRSITHSIRRVLPYIPRTNLPAPADSLRPRSNELGCFHVVFGRSVPDISLNAVANLGYAECRFLRPVFPGDTLKSTSEVIGLKQNSSGKTGIVWVRTRGENQHEETVVEFVRWVMVLKRDLGAPPPGPINARAGGLRQSVRTASPRWAGFPEL